MRRMRLSGHRLRRTRRASTRSKATCRRSQLSTLSVTGTTLRNSTGRVSIAEPVAPLRTSNLHRPDGTLHSPVLDIEQIEFPIHLAPAQPHNDLFPPPLRKGTSPEGAHATCVGGCANYVEDCWRGRRGSREEGTYL